MGSVFLVDSSILLARLDANENAERAGVLLQRAQAAGTLVINGVVVAEITPSFKTADEIQQFMNDHALHYYDLRIDTAIEAGRLWKKFLQAGGRRRERIIADFIIAACGIECGGLVTLDDRFPRIPGLRIFS